jgi:hypothetical protein
MMFIAAALAKQHGHGTTTDPRQCWFSLRVIHIYSILLWVIFIIQL